jgi:hypothetical protein
MTNPNGNRSGGDRAEWLARVADECLVTRRVPMVDEGPEGLTSIFAEADWPARTVRFRAGFGSDVIVCSRPMPPSWPHVDVP